MSARGTATASGILCRENWQRTSPGFRRRLPEAEAICQMIVEGYRFEMDANWKGSVSGAQQRINQFKARPVRSGPEAISASEGGKTDGLLAGNRRADGDDRYSYHLL